MRKNFNDIDIYAGIQSQNGAEWQKANGIAPNWNTPEHIDVKPVYTKEDLEGMEHLDYTAGLSGIPTAAFKAPPYLLMVSTSSCGTDDEPWRTIGKPGSCSSIAFNTSKASGGGTRRPV